MRIPYLRHRLLLGNCLTLFLVVGLVVFVFAERRVLRQQSRQLSQARYAAGKARELSLYAQYIQHDTNAYLLGHREHADEYADHIAALGSVLDDLQQDIDTGLLSRRRQAALDDLLRRSAEDRAAVARLFRVADEHRRSASRETQARVDAAWEVADRLGDALDDESDALRRAILQDDVAGLQAAHDEQNRRFVGFVAALGAGVILLATVLYAMTARAVGAPLDALRRAVQRCADGDLSVRVASDRRDEVGELASAFDRLAASLEQSRTELRQTETQLVQSAKLAALGEMSAGVAHELNQPLAVIRGTVQQMNAEPDLSPFFREDLTLIEGQTGRMVKIINHLRTFCRAGGGAAERLDLNTVVENCLTFIGQQLKAHDVQVALDLCPGPALVRADTNELEQVFLNLITNARDALLSNAAAAGGEGARITIRSRVTSSGGVTAEVCDNGPGIPDAVRERIFEPFFTTKEVGKGTGLGLSISHNIVAKHGGTLDARNEDGAVFRISFPAAVAEEPEELPRAA